MERERIIDGESVHAAMRVARQETVGCRESEREAEQSVSAAAAAAAAAAVSMFGFDSPELHHQTIQQ
jgi:hypothetical protein